jgi:hypothetical protein
MGSQQHCIKNPRPDQSCCECCSCGWIHFFVGITLSSYGQTNSFANPMQISHHVLNTWKQIVRVSRNQDTILHMLLTNPKDFRLICFHFGLGYSISVSLLHFLIFCHNKLNTQDK